MGFDSVVVQSTNHKNRVGWHYYGYIMAGETKKLLSSMKILGERLKEG